MSYYTLNAKYWPSSPREREGQSPDVGGPSPGKFSQGHLLAPGQLSKSASLTANEVLANPTPYAHGFTWTFLVVLTAQET